MKLLMMREQIEGQTRHLYTLIGQGQFHNTFLLSWQLSLHVTSRRSPWPAESLTLMSIDPCLLSPSHGSRNAWVICQAIKSAHQLIVCTTQKLARNWLHDNSRLRFYGLGEASWLKRWAAILHCQISCLTPSLGNLLCQCSRRACIDLVVPR